MRQRKAEPALARKREADALNLRLAGATFEAIAGQLGFRSRDAAFRSYQRAMQRLAPIPEREKAREMEAARLDRLQLPHWQKALAGDAEATDAVLKIMARRARLLGLDAPIDVNLNALLKVIAELRRLPEGDLLEVLGYVEQLSLPEHPEEEQPGD